MERRAGPAVGIAAVQAQGHVRKQVPGGRVVGPRGERVLQGLARVEEAVVQEEIGFGERPVAGARRIPVVDRAFEVAARGPRVPARQLRLPGGEGLGAPLLRFGVDGAEKTESERRAGEREAGWTALQRDPDSSATGSGVKRGAGAGGSTPARRSA